jgi:hypothetical protein
MSANHRFQFQRRGQLSIGTRNEPLSVTAVSVSIVRSVGEYKPPFPIRETRSVFHLRVGDGAERFIYPGGGPLSGSSVTVVPSC